MCKFRGSWGAHSKRNHVLLRSARRTPHTPHTCAAPSTRPLQVKVEKNTTIEISGCAALGGSLGGGLEVFGWRQERLMLMPAGWRHTMLCTLCRTPPPSGPHPPHPTDSPPIPFTHLHPRRFDKELVGQFAANVRSKREPEPYKGKGVR